MGIIVALLAIPINFPIIMLFRRAKVRLINAGLFGQVKSENVSLWPYSNLSKCENEFDEKIQSRNGEGGNIFLQF